MRIQEVRAVRSALLRLVRTAERALSLVQKRSYDTYEVGPDTALRFVHDLRQKLKAMGAILPTSMPLRNLAERAERDVHRADELVEVIVLKTMAQVCRLLAVEPWPTEAHAKIVDLHDQMIDACQGLVHSPSFFQRRSSALKDQSTLSR